MKIDKGEIGTVFGIRVVESPMLQPDQFAVVPMPPEHIRAQGQDVIFRWCAGHSILVVGVKP